MFAQNNVRTADRRVRFPVTIRHRTSKAKIYAPAGKFAYYRVLLAVRQGCVTKIRQAEYFFNN